MEMSKCDGRVTLSHCAAAVVVVCFFVLNSSRFFGCRAYPLACPYAHFTRKQYVDLP